MMAKLILVSITMTLMVMMKPGASLSLIQNGKTSKLSRKKAMKCYLICIKVF